MSVAENADGLGPAERDRLLGPFLSCRKILIAISGGPDSTALAWLATHWRAARLAARKGAGEVPVLLAATVNHGLRSDSAAEAEQVGRWCASIGLRHTVLHWQGEKPAHGIQDAARTARYDLLIQLAHETGADALAVAHTQDDQAETVLFRLARGSGLSGLAAMKPTSERAGITILRPLLEVPKVRLVATLQAENIGFVQDPANANPRFTRARLRALAPSLAQEGLDARRLSLLAARMARADDALEAATDEAGRLIGQVAPEDDEAVRLDASAFAQLPDEIAQRLLGRAITRMGHEGPVELGKLETLAQALLNHLRALPDVATGFGRTLAGAQVEIRSNEVWIFPAPPRRKGTIPPKSPLI